MKYLLGEEMNDRRWKWLNKIECVMQCEEVDALDPLFPYPPLRFLWHGSNLHEINMQLSVGQRSNTKPSVSDR